MISWWYNSNSVLLLHLGLVSKFDSFHDMKKEDFDVEHQSNSAGCKSKLSQHKIQSALGTYYISRHIFVVVVEIKSYKF